GEGWPAGFGALAPPDHALLRRAGHEDDLHHFAAGERERREAGGQAAHRRHLRARGRCPRRAGREVQGLIMALNVCMVGYGMMGQWHSEALKRTDAVLHTVVGRGEEAAKEFAAQHGYKKWSVSLGAALADPSIDIVILGSPSEQHEAQAIQCLEAGKHTLIEIPIAMSLAGAERVVAAGE